MTKRRASTTIRLLLVILAATFLLPQAAFSAATQAGEKVTNGVSLSYKVDTIAQTAITNSVDFWVDHLLSVGVVNGTEPVSVANKQNKVSLSFTVSNNGNYVQDIILFTEHNTSDNFNATIINTAIDSNGNGVYDDGSDALSNKIDNLAYGLSNTIFIVANIPDGNANGAISGIYLIGKIANATDSTLITTDDLDTGSPGDDTSAVEYVLYDIDGAATGDALNDGSASDYARFQITTAILDLAKSVTTLWDPVNNATNPHSIPGAYLTYSITVTNNGGSGGASAILNSITDTIDTASVALDADFVNSSGPGNPSSGSTGDSVYITLNNDDRGWTSAYFTADAADADNDGVGYVSGTGVLTINLDEILDISGSNTQAGELRSAATAISVTIKYNVKVNQ